MNFRLNLGAALLLPICVVAPVLGQVGRGILAGSVSDGQGSVLQGAKVTADPGGATVLSDQTGQFTLSGLAAGEYTVTVAYTGFSPSEQKVTLVAGQSAH